MNQIHPPTHPESSTNTKNSDRPGTAGWPLVLASLPLILFLLLPLVGLLFRVSSTMLSSSLKERQVIEAMSLSFSTTLTTVCLTVLFGTPVAYLLARKNFFGRTLLDALIDMPLVLPPAVAGVALLIAFGRRGFLGPILGGAEIPFTRTAVVLAQLFVASPYYIKSAASGFANINRELEQAAAVDGATRSQAFRTIIVPLSLPSIIGGIVMTWARALGEFGATIIFAGNFPGRTQTMPLAIYIGFEIDLQIALVLAVILLSISFLVLAIVKGVLGRQLSPL
ncbi:MAG TPA: ABC transporter permease [Bacteroidota bacterium]|nr:ABC transporter permease [Bacteroidota bacterium]